ncbi:hypothetical protein EXIGLDRAFT_715981 [Exidia glandulosa HHB12029]|uniref:Zn(2)-C6 fungal-type domain-containing protein n=1 Tax=Exidia glandulosa HHB12029 TaxID=1314781 RepID=A0A165QQZ9_EXIGL|nr:hypothetical protein EXIGLDRAFT_715981 [Exidia glandulosa HHB12029]
MVTNGKKQKLDTQFDNQDSLKPLQLQRRRVWRACESCRRKKIKCDGREPTCSQCSTSKTQCVWVQTRDRAALSRHYVQELEQRLVQMENILTQVAPVVELIGQSPNGIVLPNGAQVSGSAEQGLATSASQTGAGAGTGTTSQQPIGLKPESEDVPRNPCGIKEAVPRETAENDDVVDKFGQLTLDEHGHLRWIGGSSAMALVQSFRELSANRPSPPDSPDREIVDGDPRQPNVNMLYFPPGLGFGKVHALPGAHEVEWPERDLADKLIEAYFERFHFLLPVLDKISFLEDYRKLMEEDGNHDDAGFVSVVFAVFACAARFVDDPRLTEGVTAEEGGVGMIYYERAMILYYIGNTQGNTQLAQVQAFVLLASFLCSVNCLPQAWLMVGQAVRTAQDLGLHRSPRQLRLKLVKKELRRKVWWSVYVLDRMLAVALGRPLGIEDIDCDVELPLAIDDDGLRAYFDHEEDMREAAPTLMTGFIALINLTKKAGLILRTVYGLHNCKDNMSPEELAAVQTQIDVFDADLTRWCTELPPAFKSNPVGAQQVTMGAVLCSSYYAVLITLHRKVMPTRTTQGNTSSTSFAKAVAAARSCIMLAPSIKDAIPASHHLSFFIQYLFSSAVIILLCVINSNPDETAANTVMSEVDSCINALSTQEGRWPGAGRCKSILQELVKVTNQARANAAQKKTEMKVEPLTPALSDRPAFRKIAKKPTSRPSSRVRAEAKQELRSPDSAYAPSDHSFLSSPASVGSSKALKRSHDEAENTDATSIASTSPMQLPPHQTFGYNQYPAPPGTVDPSMFNQPESTLSGVTVRDFAPPFPQQNVYNGAQSSWNLQAIDPRDSQQQQQFIYQGSPLSMNGSGNGNGDSALFPNGTSGNGVDPTMFSFQGQASQPGGFDRNTPPGSSPPGMFDMSGIDFAGLDFLQNFTPGGYVGASNDGQNDMDTFWQNFVNEPLQQPFGALAENNGTYESNG